MAKSRKNPGRDANVKKYKNKHKRKTMDEQANSNYGLPEIRQSPVWNSDEMLEITGQEWEHIFNFIEGSSSAFMAANAVMSRNIMNGKVKLKFEKLNKETFQYEDMTPEEEAPYQAEFKKAVDQAIAAQKKASEKKSSLIVVPEDITEEETSMEPPSQEGLPRIDAIVDAQGNELK